MGLQWSCEMPPVTVFKDHCKFVNYYSSQLLESNCKKTGCLRDIEMGSEQKKKNQEFISYTNPFCFKLEESIC